MLRSAPSSRRGSASKTTRHLLGGDIEKQKIVAVNRAMLESGGVLGQAQAAATGVLGNLQDKLPDDVKRSARA